MKNCTAILGRSLVILCLAACLHLEAADQRETNLPVKVAAPQAAAAWQRRLSEVNFDNSPLDDVVRQLRERFPEINFLIKTQGDLDTEPGTTEIPVAVRLNSVTLAEILKALELGAARPIQITGAPDERLVVFERQRNPKPAVQIEAENRIITRVFNLGSYLAGRSDEEINPALEQLYEVVDLTGKLLRNEGGARESGARDFSPRLHVHKNTKLLIAVGRADELAVVSEVITRLQEPVHPRPPKNKPVAEPAGPKVTTPQ
jgi:hypothetical protein